MSDEVPHAPADTGRDPSGRYLAFLLGEQSYAVAVQAVREIIRLAPITPVPHAPDGVRGVINLRGRIVPVISLRAKLGLAASNLNERTCVVIVQVEFTERVPTLLGLIVDGVQAVTSIAEADIQDPPHVGAARSDAIVGLTRGRDAVTALLDIRALVTGASLAPAA